MYRVCSTSHVLAVTGYTVQKVPTTRVYLCSFSFTSTKGTKGMGVVCAQLTGHINRDLKIVFKGVVIQVAHFFVFFFPLSNSSYFFNRWLACKRSHCKSWQSVPPWKKHYLATYQICLYNLVNKNPEKIHKSIMHHSNSISIYFWLLPGKANPKEIEHNFKISMRDMSPCKGSQRYEQFRSAFEQEVGDTLGTIHGCLNPSSCKMKEVTVPGCGWTANERKRRAVVDANVVLFSLSVKAFDSDSTKDAIGEKSEAILFQIKYAVSTGQFVIVLDGVNSTANRSSFEHVSSNVICNPGYVKRSDRRGCGKYE